MEKIIDEVKCAKSIAISGHVRPDGDCIGSTVGLYLYLKKAMPDTKVQVFLEESSQVFNCIKGVDEINTSFQTEEVFDVFIACDCGADRTGGAVPIFEKAQKTINVDHHISNQGTCDINYIVPTASSTSELIYDIIDESVIDVEIAKALYLGIAHDTGVMRYSNTSPKTLQTVAKLIAFGFDFSELINLTFVEKSYAQNQILGSAVLDSKLHIEGKVISSIVNREKMEQYGVSSTELEGIVNQLLLTSGVECAIFLYEMKENTYKVSMRSKKYIDVAAIASMFGGGGHVRAAGCTVEGNAEHIVEQLVKQMTQ